MELINVWTGRTACALQRALRLTNEAFADHLGVAVRTVATWHQRPDVVPKADVQQALDTTLERASNSVKARFARDMRGSTQPASTAPNVPDTAQALRVAVAIVVKEKEILLVCRRGEDGGGISWQFPAGVIKPGGRPEQTAVRETLAETGVHCTVTRGLGSRLHPITNVFCDYLLCEYLGGDAENIDVVENVSVAWVDKSRLTRFIPAERIFPPIMEALEVSNDPADS